MPKKKITEKQALKFRCWLLKNELSVAEFAKLCGVSRQYISQAINGTYTVTPQLIETFKKGGYNL